MRFSGIAWSKNEAGKVVLEVTFEEGDEKNWVPKWKDLHSALRAAIITEVINSGGIWNKEMMQFFVTGEFLRHVCKIVATMNDVRLE